MKILVVIVTYNGMNWLPKALGSVCDHDVMVIDNGSSDGSPAWIKSEFPDVILVESKENLGFGKANNIGLRYVVDNGYDYVYLLNQDAWVFPDTIPALVDAAEANREYGLISPMQMTAGLDKMDRNFKSKCGKYLKTASELAEVRFVMAAHWLIPIQTIRLVGGFSPVFPHNSEDNDYIHRIHFHGMKAGVLKTVQAVHDRENRPYDKARHMWRKYMTAIAGITDPNRKFVHQVIVQSLALIVFCVRYLSLLPLKYMFSLLGRLPELKMLHEASGKQGAYLE